jgi:uncharacterized protein (TIGR03000 family)
MLRARLKKFALLAVLAAAFLSLSATPSQAGWGHHARWYDCSPSYVAVYRSVYAYSSCCEPCASCGWGYARGYYGVPDYAGYSGYYGYHYGGTAGCCGGGQVLSVESAAPVVTTPAAPALAPAPSKAPDSVLHEQYVPDSPQPALVPADEPSMPPLPGDASPAKSPVPAPAVPAGEKSTRAPHNGTLLTVVVPEDAKVYMNGQLTKTPGTHRQYISRGLQPGQRYTYEVQAVVNRGGQALRDTQVVQVRAGQTAQVAFQFDRASPTQLSEAAGAVRTTLTLQLPEDAKVVLAGNLTGATGAIRRYTTTGLAKGEKWEDYRVLATAVRNGRTVTQERTIRLTGGESKLLHFQLDDRQVATR